MLYKRFFMRFFLPGQWWRLLSGRWVKTFQQISQWSSKSCILFDEFRIIIAQPQKGLELTQQVRTQTLLESGNLVRISRNSIPTDAVSQKIDLRLKKLTFLEVHEQRVFSKPLKNDIEVMHVFHCGMRMDAHIIKVC